MKKKFYLTITILICAVIFLLPISGCIGDTNDNDDIEERKEYFIKCLQTMEDLLMNPDIKMQVEIFDSISCNYEGDFIIDGNKIKMYNDIMNDWFILFEKDNIWLYICDDNGKRFRTLSPRENVNVFDRVGMSIDGFSALSLFKDNFDWFYYDKITKEYSLKPGHVKEIYPLLNGGKELKEEDYDKEYLFKFKFTNGKISEWISIDYFWNTYNRKYVFGYKDNITVEIPDYDYER